MKKKNVMKLLVLGAFLFVFSINASSEITMSKLIKKTITVPIPPQEAAR